MSFSSAWQTQAGNDVAKRLYLLLVQPGFRSVLSVICLQLDLLQPLSRLRVVKECE